MNTSPVRKMTGHLRNGQNMRVGVLVDKVWPKWQRFLLFLYVAMFEISFSISIYQIENTNDCITLLKEAWSLGAQEDRTAL